MRWPSALLRNSRIGKYRKCSQLLMAYWELAPWWERLCLLAYCGLGTYVADRLGVDTTEIWQRGESVVGDVFSASQMAPEEIAELLRTYVSLRLRKSPPLAFDAAQSLVYNRAFYPLVQHLNFALQPSAAARMDFVREVADSVEQVRASVLDLGCGPGVMLCRILKPRPGWVGHGLDISPCAVEYGKRLAALKGVASRVEFRVGDAARLPFSDQSADLLIASEVLEHVPAIESALGEIARVVRPGGRAVITLPIETRAVMHIHSLKGEEYVAQLCERAGLEILQLRTRREPFGYGDDPGHIFLAAASRGQAY